MKLDYATMICYDPIPLSIGTIIKPTLAQIFDTNSGMNFYKFEQYEALTMATSEFLYKIVKGEEGKLQWENFTDFQKQLDLFDTILNDDFFIEIYLELLNFFFIEPVIFFEGYFITLKREIGEDESITNDMIKAVINKESFMQILDIIQQICCIKNENKKQDLKFKNDIARKLYEKMQNNKNKINPDYDMAIPNIISVLSNKHNSLNYTNIFDLTVFQLMDSFTRTKINAIHDLNAIRVSFHGDKDNKYDEKMWYKNYYDK